MGRPSNERGVGTQHGYRIVAQRAISNAQKLIRREPPHEPPRNGELLNELERMSRRLNHFETMLDDQKSLNATLLVLISKLEDEKNNHAKQLEHMTKLHYKSCELFKQLGVRDKFETTKKFAAFYRDKFETTKKLAAFYRDKKSIDPFDNMEIPYIQPTYHQNGAFYGSDQSANNKINVDHFFV